jgi:hypothetical protein
MFEKFQFLLPVEKPTEKLITMKTISNNKITPIFGFGYMRSGTTLLFNILKNHPDIYTGAQEPKIIDNLLTVKKTYPELHESENLLGYIAYCANVARFGDAFNHLAKPLIEDDAFGLADLQALTSKTLDHEYIPLLRAVYDHLAKNAGKKFWYFKSQVIFFTEIIHWIPYALFLEIIRDPRDVLASKKKDKAAVWSSKYPQEKQALKYLEKTYDPVWDSLSWKSEIKTGNKIKQAFPGQIFSVRYEDLVADPKTWTKNCCAFLGINFKENQLNVPRRNTSMWDNRPSGIGTQSVNKWKLILTPEEVAICQLLVRHQLIQLEYKIEPIKINILKLSKILIASVVEFFTRLRKRKELHGRSFLRSVLNLYWKKLKNLL